MQVVLKFSRDNDFYDVLLILRFIPPFDRLTMVQLRVYAKLLTHYYDIEELTKKQREERIFSYDLRRKIQDELNINDSVFRNCLSALRRVGVLNKTELVDKYIIEYGDTVSVNFKQ